MTNRTPGLRAETKIFVLVPVPPPMGTKSMRARYEPAANAEGWIVRAVAPEPLVGTLSQPGDPASYVTEAVHAVPATDEVRFRVWAVNAALAADMKTSDAGLINCGPAFTT